jgi:hypothetical protein
MGVDEAHARIRADLESRERRFPELLRHTVFDQPRSPYLRLLKQAGCEFGDVRSLVEREGLEPALRTLADRGVYVTTDELKGRRPAVRGSSTMWFAESDFDSPGMAAHWLVPTGGTRGQPSQVLRSLGLLERIAAEVGATFAAHGLDRPLHAFWLTNPIAQMLIYSKLGHRVLRWDHMRDPFPVSARLAASGFRALARAGGRTLPTPRFLHPNAAGELADWLSGRPRDGSQVVLSTLSSAAVRVAVAAAERGLDLEGVTFHVQSEPVTEARFAHLTAGGARVITNYGSIESPGIAYSCATPTAPDDLHVFTQRYALIERPAALGALAPSVNALLVTTLTSNAGKVCLNVETGDCAEMSRRECECSLGVLGLTTHLSNVRSFEKLSAEGVTFVRSNLVPILEQTLPSRFGGSAVDYQLVEQEGTDSATRVVLRVSPSVGPVDEAAMIADFLAELARDGVVSESHAALLRYARSVAVERAEPLPSAAGKVLPFHLNRRVSR